MNATISMTNKLRGTVSMANSKINGGASPYPKGASGDIITITDGADNTPLKSAVVNIEPVQDLHGYSYPWPGGGGGNLFDYDQTVGASIIETAAIQLEPGTYYVYVAGKSANWNSYIQISTDGSSYSNITTDSSVQTAYADYAMGYNIKKCILTVVSPIYARQILQVNANVQNDRVAVMYTKDGTGYSSVPAALTYSTTQWQAIYQPYSNICPISGHTEVNVYDDPKYGGTIAWNQQAKINIASGTVNSVSWTTTDNVVTINGTATANTYKPICSLNIAVTKDHIYYLCGNRQTTTNTAGVLYYNDNGTYRRDNGQGVVFKALASASGKNLTVSVNSGETVTNYKYSPQFFDLTQMFGATKSNEIYAMEQAQAGSGVAYFKSLFPKDYYPYNAGEETCVSAVNGDPYTKETISLGQTVYGGTLDVVKGKLNAKPYYASYSGQTLIGPWISSHDKYVAGATPTTGAQVVDMGAAGTEYDVTPQTIKTLLGTNNIWADAGEISIEYYPAAASIVAVQNRSTKAYVSIPLGMIRYETYQITPQQTIDLDSYRSENGNLLRNPVATKCKLEFNTPLMTDTQWGEIWSIIKAGFNNNTERKLKLRYYDTLSATYKTGYFYVPDVQTTIRNIDEGAGVINYNEIRIAFIEY